MAHWGAVAPTEEKEKEKEEEEELLFERHKLLILDAKGKRTNWL